MRAPKNAKKRAVALLMSVSLIAQPLTVYADEGDDEYYEDPPQYEESDPVDVPVVADPEQVTDPLPADAPMLSTGDSAGGEKLPNAADETRSDIKKGVGGISIGGKKLGLCDLVSDPDPSMCPTPSSYESAVGILLGAILADKSSTTGSSADTSTSSTTSATYDTGTWGNVDWTSITPVSSRGGWVDFEADLGTTTLSPNVSWSATARGSTELDIAVSVSPLNPVQGDNVTEKITVTPRRTGVYVAKSGATNTYTASNLSYVNTYTFATAEVRKINGVSTPYFGVLSVTITTKVLQTDNTLTNNNSDDTYNKGNDLINSLGKVANTSDELAGNDLLAGTSAGVGAADLQQAGVPDGAVDDDLLGVDPSDSDATGLLAQAGDALKNMFGLGDGDHGADPALIAPADDASSSGSGTSADAGGGMFAASAGLSDNPDGSTSLRDTAASVLSNIFPTSGILDNATRSVAASANSADRESIAALTIYAQTYGIKADFDGDSPYSNPKNAWNFNRLGQKSAQKSAAVAQQPASGGTNNEKKL